MNLNDKNTRITLRVNSKLFNYIQTKSDMMGVSPSEFIRICMNSIMHADSLVANQVSQEVSRRENEQTCINDII